MMDERSLYGFNTFGIRASARAVVPIFSEEELRSFIHQHTDATIRILGGGSNILLTGDVDAIVLRICIPGISVVAEEGDSVLVEAGAGENWHHFVQWTLDRGLGGLENLSLIPGCVGAAPMQNIGAYGVEQDQRFVSLTAMDMTTGDTRIISRDECAFGYRESRFKREWRGQYCITRVVYRLTARDHRLQTEYGAIKELLPEKDPTLLTPRDIAEAVIAIRRSKLPDPAEIGNAGSFFKNPVIPAVQFEALRSVHTSIPSYPAEEGYVKVPAGWLIEQCGWKGYREGDAGVHTRQALVLVNYGSAAGEDILALSRKVQASVWATFGIHIEPEVNIW